MLAAVQLMSAVHCASVVVATVVVESGDQAVGIATAVCVGASLCGYRRIGPLACAAGAVGHGHVVLVGGAATLV